MDQINKISEIIMYVFVGLMFLYPIVTAYILYRNIRVFNFRTDILDLEFKRHIESVRKNPSIPRPSPSNKHTYNQMLYSFKPLKLRYWFTEEEINYLTTPIQ